MKHEFIFAIFWYTIHLHLVYGNKVIYAGLWSTNK